MFSQPHEGLGQVGEVVAEGAMAGGRRVSCQRGLLVANGLFKKPPCLREFPLVHQQHGQVVEDASQPGFIVGQ